MRLELFIWSTIINGIFSFAMVALVLFSRPLTKVKIYWSAMCAATGAWSLGLTWMSATKDYSIALFGSQLVTGFSIFIPTFLYHTVHALLKRNSNLPLYIFYGAAIILSAFNFRGDLMTVAPALDFYFYTTAKPAYMLFMLHVYGGFAIILFTLWKAAYKAQPLIKKQLMSLFWGAALGFLGGQMTVPLVYKLPIFPYGVFFVPIYILMVGRGMLKYQFMDFKLALKKLGLTIVIYTLSVLILLPSAWPLIRRFMDQPSNMLFQVAILSCFTTLLLAAGPIIYALVLQRTYWLKSQSTIGLTHELKSPLTTVRGAVDFMTTQLPNLYGNTEQFSDYLKIIERNTSRLEAFVGDLLSMAAIQEGEISLDMKQFSLTETTRVVLDNYRSMANQKGIALKLVFDKDISIHADQAKLQQVISNLVSNAVKFSNNGTIEIKIIQTTNHIKCSVKDAGIGLKTGDLNRIFNRFYQGAHSNRGAGIGLAIAKAWVQAHGGSIWAESNGPGTGTNIKFHIPTY